MAIKKGILQVTQEVPDETVKLLEEAYHLISHFPGHLKNDFIQLWEGRAKSLLDSKQEVASKSGETEARESGEKELEGPRV